VVAVVKAAKSTSEAEIMAAAGQSLARYKCPRAVHFVEELPRNTMGKVQKNLLRDSYG